MGETGLEDERLALADQLEELQNQDSLRRRNQAEDSRQINQRYAEVSQQRDAIEARRISVLRDLGRETLRSLPSTETVQHGDAVFAELDAFQVLVRARDEIEAIRQTFSEYPSPRMIIGVICITAVAIIGVLKIIF